MRLIRSCIEYMNDVDIDIEDGDLANCVFDVDETPYERIKKAGELDQWDHLIDHEPVFLTMACISLSGCPVPVGSKGSLCPDQETLS